jgi:hypothetical protein
MYSAPQNNEKPPFLSKGCVAIRHPGQVRRRRTRAGIQNKLITLDFHRIPDLIHLRWTRPE